MSERKAAEAQAQQEQKSPCASADIHLGREPMTGAQASSLKQLAEEMKEPHAFEPGLTKSEASRRIYRLQERLRLGQLPPHTD